MRFAAALTVLALAGCTSQPHVTATPAPPPSSSVSPTPDPSPSNRAYPSTFKDADEIWQTLHDTDTLGCGDPTPIASPIAATSLIDCGPHVVIAVYPDRRTTDAAFDRVHGRYPQDPLQACIGADWMVTGEWENWLHQVCDLLGGKYRAAPGASPTT